MTEPEPPSRTSIFKTGIGKAGIGLSVVLMGAALAPIFFISSDNSSAWLQNIGNLGQYVSGLFAPVAFVWIVIAVILQGRELELQREELKDTREVLGLQKDEMKHAAEEAREQTRIMTENLRAEAERQVYAEVDIILYSLALFIVSNVSLSRVSIGEGSKFAMDASKLYHSVDKSNFDRVYALVYQSLLSADKWIHHNHGKNFMLENGGREFFLYCHETLLRVSSDKKYKSNDLAVARLKGLQISESLALLANIKRSVIG